MCGFSVICCCAGKTSPSKPSSQNSSFTGTPNSKPLLDEQVVLKSANRALNIGPKNLLEVRETRPQSVCSSGCSGRDRGGLECCVHCIVLDTFCTSFHRCLAMLVCRNVLQILYVLGHFQSQNHFCFFTFYCCCV